MLRTHSTEFSGGACYCSSKSPGGEDLEIEEPILCGDCASFHFHPAEASVLGAPLIRYGLLDATDKKDLGSPQECPDPTGIPEGH